MTRLIDADKLFETIRSNDYILTTVGNCVDNGMFTLGIKQAIDEQPTVDAVPLIHAYWKSEGHKLSRFCSHCFHDEPYKFAEFEADVYNYCPHCGAKMDGGKP